MVDLTPFNTLHVQAFAQNLLPINSPSDIKKIPQNENLLIIGLGSNILFTRDFSGTIIKIDFFHLKILKETKNHVVVEVSAGHSWHRFVTWAVSHDLYGLENMALIPGTVGGAVVGNIAAYGGNQEDVFVSLSAYNIDTGKTEKFSKPDCQFTYRGSFFKKHRNYLITSVTYRLSKTPTSNIHYHDRYTSLETELTRLRTKANPANSRPDTLATTWHASTNLRSAEPYSVKEIYQAVINIRTAKLPNWDKVGTAGSFFKNPLVSKRLYLNLKSQVKDLQWYPAEKLQYNDKTEVPDIVKIPAGRLLDELGWKGKTIGQVSTSPNHALYIINLGSATGQAIFEYAEAMRSDILQNFGLNLEYEVRLV